MNMLKIADKTFHSRLFTGTGKFGSLQVMEDALLSSGSELVTVALRRAEVGRPVRAGDGGAGDADAPAHECPGLMDFLRHPHLHLLPNTSGVRDAREAVF